jgi:hypothetical protein
MTAARPSLQDVVAAVACVLLLLSGAATFVDPDAWHLIALAREIVAHGAIPLADQFAYTPTVFPVVHHEWASGMLVYALATHGGTMAMQLARATLVTVVVTTAVAVARQRGATPSTLAVLAVPASIMSWIAITAMRPQLTTLAFLALWLGAIESDRRGGRAWIALALAGHVVWLNLHGGFVVGMGFLALHAVEQAMRRQPFLHVVAVVIAQALLVACNPYGVAYYGYLAHALTMARPLIGEWQPIWQAHPVGLGVYVATLVIAGAALVRGGGPRRTPGWPILLVAAALAARHERHVSIHALVWFAYVPGLVARTRIGDAMQRAWEGPPTPVRFATGLVALGFAATLFLSNRPWRLTVPGTTPDGAPAPYPVGPVAYLAEQHVRGNLLVPFGAGAYVAWKLHPDVKVSLDSRYEAAFPPELLAEHLRFFGAMSGWRAFLDRYPTDLVLTPSDAPIAEPLATQTAWTVVYRDDAYLLFARPGLVLQERDRRGERLVGTFP